MCGECQTEGVETDLRTAARLVSDKLADKQRELTQHKHRTQRLIYHQELDVKDIERDSLELHRELTEKCAEVRALLAEKEKEMVKRLELLRNKR